MSKTKTFAIWGIVFTIVLGILFHFLYDWLGQPQMLKFMLPVSESVGQHLKLLIFPNLIYGIIMCIPMQKYVRGYWIRLILGTIIGMVLIEVLFYLSTWMLGRNYLWIDILIFIISAIVSYSFYFKRGAEEI